MAKRVVLISDISGQEIPDDEQVELRVLEFPELSQPVRLDLSTTEASRLKLEASPLALLELVVGENVERIAISADALRKAIKGDADEVMANAEALTFARPQETAPEQPRRRGRRPRGEGEAAGTKPEKVNYTDDDKYGQLHRGRLTDEEIELVIQNPAQASRNREAQGHPAIDWDDAKEQSRYHLDASLVTDIKAKLAD